MTEKFKALIGYDGSDYAEAAIDELPRAGLPEETEAFVATVSEMWVRMPLSYGGVETSYVDRTITGEAQAAETAKKGAEKLREMFPAWMVDYGAAVGSTANILLSKADDWKPHLIVIGSQSRGAIGRFFFGSAAQSLVANAVCSVRVARKKEADSNAEIRLMVGVDGSKHSEAAVEAIINRYAGKNCHVRVVSATDFVTFSSIKNFDLVEPNQVARDASFQQEMKRAEDAAFDAVTKLEEAGFSVSSVINNKAPGDLIIEEAKEWNADCIFVGARGMNRIERILIGSVSSAVAARAQCTVEVVRPK